MGNNTLASKKRGKFNTGICSAAMVRRYARSGTEDKGWGT